MSLSAWFPALTTTTFAACVLWLLRNLITARLTKSVEHEFNEKLEHLRAELREADERFKADLRAKEAEIAVLRSGALSAMASRQIAVDKRRLEAIDQLWTAFNSYGGAKSLSLTLSTIIFEEAAKYSESDPKTRQFFETLGTGFEPKLIDHASAAKARPFVSAMAWATYTAYTAICMHAVLRWHVLRYGLGTKKLIDDEVIKKLIITALPYYSDYLEKFGPDCYHYILDALETKLLQEIQQMLSGAETDQASIQQAAEILRKSSAVFEQVTEVQNTASSGSG